MAHKKVAATVTKQPRLIRLREGALVDLLTRRRAKDRRTARTAILAMATISSIRMKALGLLRFGLTLFSLLARGQILKVEMRGRRTPSFKAA
jgi:hypothetical protein